MTANEQAKQMVELFKELTSERYRNTTFWHENIEKSKECALICVNQIILSNPHSNPFNSDQKSTMDYWNEVKKEIEKL